MLQAMRGRLGASFPMRFVQGWPPVARVALAVVVAVAVSAPFLALGSGGVASASDGPLPVPYSAAAGIAAELASPGAAPPGANNWSCKPSAAHPEPVILVHGFLANMTENWQTMAPVLSNNGYCVFALNYGAIPGVGFPLDQAGGLLPMDQSAKALGAFVDRVLGATGASKVDIVGHSEGGTMPYYYLKFLGGDAKVDRYVGLASVYHGTNLDGLSPLLTQLARLFPTGSQLVAQYCGACQEFLPGSGFLDGLDPDGAAVAGVTFTNITSRLDEVVVPYTSGFLNGPNVTNIVVQDQCGLDLSDHVALVADPIAGQDVLNALDPAHAAAPLCQVVLPFLG